MNDRKAWQEMESTQLALLLVDIQRDFWRPLSDEPLFTSFPTNIRMLLTVARAQQLPIVHTQAVFQADGTDWMLFYRPRGRGCIPCIAGSDGVAIEDFAAPLTGEPVIRKHTFDGFANTDLERVLRARNIKALMVAGLVTSVCVLFTATSAYLKRFVPIVVSDACADSAENHEAALRMYSGLCFQRATTAQVQNDLSSLIHLAEQFAEPSPCSPAAWKLVASTGEPG
jgi:nicotinamidase-related amidase